jgi:hypothetical protein
VAGEDFYHSVLSIADGVASKRPLMPALPAEITAALESALPVRAERFSLRRIRMKAN